MQFDMRGREQGRAEKPESSGGGGRFSSDLLGRRLKKGPTGGHRPHLSARGGGGRAARGWAKAGELGQGKRPEKERGGR
ncbi:hypothetical protein E2562_027235 [Oryza meyeriana var. granulata]|uniref:Uncharacterized protein n=1 Tax=Oryza meyeriana var. granulata TaxID=110450 RepID=A0A6G1D8F3_9ORYZ|nr:hypothetical protein E2562_027235 [Oryza meyeriana var. granulata]